jgi:hypothetical protein
MPPKTYVKPCGYEQITVSTTALALTIPAGASRAVLVVEDQPLRYRDDAVAPTASVGMLCVATTRFELESRESMIGFKAIRSGGTNSVLSVSYYR